MIDNENIEAISSDNESESTMQTAENLSSEISVEKLKTGEIDFFSLSHNERQELKQKYRETLSEREKTAMDMGWSPKEMDRGKYKDGTDRPWMDAEAFLKKIETEAPVRNERLRELTKEKEEFQNEIKKQQEQIKKLLELNRAKFERDLTNDERLVNQEIQEAEEFGDINKYKLAQERKNHIEREKLRLKTFEEPPAEPPFPKIPNTPAPLQPEVAEFAARNSEIVSNPKLLAYAHALDAAYSVSHEHLPLSERLLMVEEDTKAKFPQFFPDYKKSPVINNQRNGSIFNNKPKQKSFSDLPDIEKQQARMLIKRGVFKNEADFLKTYEW